ARTLVGHRRPLPRSVGRGGQLGRPHFFCLRVTIARLHFRIVGEPVQDFSVPAHGPARLRLPIGPRRPLGRRWPGTAFLLSRSTVMFPSSRLRQLQRRWFPGRINRRAPVRRVRPCLEALEDRTLLTSWTPIGPAPIVNGQTGGNLPVSG